MEVEEITDRPRADRTFFCIDVEDTHNFVTSGGVVHNCRPPGNRDPLPQEIDSCQDYLFRQLELIEPKVVCTLGNFATKLLRGDTTGHHAAARARGAAPDRAAGRAAVPALPPGGGALHAGRCWTRCAPTSPDPGAAGQAGARAAGARAARLR